MKVDIVPLMLKKVIRADIVPLHYRNCKGWHIYLECGHSFIERIRKDSGKPLRRHCEECSANELNKVRTMLQ
jgi:hypothetical protein